MALDNIIKILLSGASLCLGSYLTALRSKIATQKIKNNLHYARLSAAFVINNLLQLINQRLIIFWDKCWEFCSRVVVICSSTSSSSSSSSSNSSSSSSSREQAGLIKFIL